MGATDAIKVMVEGLTIGSRIYAKDEIVFDPPEALETIADERRKHLGAVMAMRVSKGAALKEAKKQAEAEKAKPEPEELPSEELPPNEDDE